MKLESIRISNMLSFEEKENIDDCQEIKFVDGINTIISPNGAGKSNFLEIINKCINKALIRQMQYSESSIRAHKIKGTPPDFTSTIKFETHDFKIAKNKYSNSNVQRIKIKIGLNEDDKKNLLFIHNNMSEIKTSFAKYCKEYPKFPDITENEVKQIDSVEILLEDVNSTGYLANMTNHNDPEQFVFFYIQYFNLLQSLIFITNKEDGKNWDLLQNTFSFLTSQRNYNQIESAFQVAGDEGSEISSAKLNLTIANMLDSDKSEPVIFLYVRKRLGYAFHHMLEEKGSDYYTQSGIDPVDEFDDELFQKINGILKKILGMRLHIKKTHPNSLDYIFSYRYLNSDQPISIQELSSGERGLIHFIFSIYGNDLSNGQMIIDEPEIHMHPQLQELCLELMLEVSKKDHIQFIIATHSPIFVNSKIISGVQRFYKKDNKFTETIIPQLDDTNKDLVRYLDYTRATKILFSDKVVLVEGDSDEYGYKFLFEQFKESNSDINKIEFIYIGGKEYYKKWKEFFDSWKIECFFIRDKDGFGGSDTDIETKYNDGIFILKQGDLETYIGNKKSNKLDNVIDFCKNRFSTWKEDSTYDDNRNEIETIFKIISS